VKLGIKEGSRVGLIAAPADFERSLGALPSGVSLRAGARGALDIAICFTKERADLTKRFPALVRAIAPAGAAWIAWPKKAARVLTDLDENVVREVGLAAGVVDVKVCAIDETWFGLKFVVRRADRKG
jgi:hypothetical protein